jgi:SAM-dependent methyltransferase
VNVDPVYHEVEWTPAAVRRFWDFYGGNAASEDSYFSKKFASRIVGLARRWAPLGGPVVDVGCGPGYLADELLRRGYAVRAVDSSPRSVERLRARLAGRPGFLGAEVGGIDALPLASGEAGSAFLVEVLEHCSADERERALREVARVLRPDGPLVVTVPHEEDLDARKVACPECGCVFHRVQHVVRFDAALLAAAFDRAGLEPVFVRALNFRHFPDRAFHPLVRMAVRRIPALGGRGTPHLMAIGRRR